MMRRWMHRRMPALAVLVAMSASSGYAQADPSEDLKAQVKSLQEQNAQMMALIQDLQRKVDANQRRSDAVLQKIDSGAGADTSAAKPKSPTPGKKPDDENFMLGVVPTVWTMGNSKLKFYGFLRLDSIYDDSGPNNPLLPFFIRSEDTEAAGAIRDETNDDSFNMDVRLTRLGLDFEGGEMDLLWNGKVGGKLEMDFDSGLGSESRAAPRIRHAYLNMKWGDVSVLAGQTWDVISPLMPMVNDHFVMWNAGNLGDRRPQFRVAWEPGLGSGKFSARAAAGLSGAINNVDRDLDGKLDGAQSGNPIYEARLGWAGPLWVDGQNFDIGFWGHYAQEEVDGTFGGGEEEVDSYSFGADLTVPIIKDLIWTSEIWTGENLPEVRGGIGQGINLQGEEIDSWGGFTQLTYKPWSWLLSGVGYALDNPDNDDLDFAIANPGRKEANETYYLSNTFYPGGNVSIKLNYLHWRTQYHQLEDGIDNRMELIFQYNW